MLNNKVKKRLLKLPRVLKRVIATSLDIVLCVLSTWFALALRLDQWGLPKGGQWWAFIISVGLITSLFTIFGHYRAIFRFIGSDALSFLGRIFLGYFFAYFIIFTIISVNNTPRSIGVIQPLLLFFAVGSSRYFVRNWLGGIATAKSKFLPPNPVGLIYGAGSAGRQLAAALSVTQEILVKGFIDDDPLLHGNSINGILVYSGDDFEGLIEKLNVTDIILAIPSHSQARRGAIIASLSGLGVRVRTIPGIFESVVGGVRTSKLQDLDMNDLLGRSTVPPDTNLLKKNIINQTVLVTGAGGSIGTELCRQIIKFSPAMLILIDSSEHALYLTNEELKGQILAEDFSSACDYSDAKSLQLSSGNSSIKLVPILASVRDAAYKHVPLVEQNQSEGILNNVFGTLNCAQAALDFGVSNFVLISTDKAVRPTSVMGVSKRIAELILQAMSKNAQEMGVKIKYSMVRFGNVLGSSGSVTLLFDKQIKDGGPITLTHQDVTRYFMTIPEAAQLVIQSCSMSCGGEVFVLDMGEPVRIYDLAVKMVYLSGLMIKDGSNPNGDIEIQVTGLRSGEKLYEELLIGDNPQPTNHPKILMALEEFMLWEDLEGELETLHRLLCNHDVLASRDILKKLVPAYTPSDFEVNLI